jgi:putative ABC transport system permease protein
MITPDYFRTMEIPLLNGRFFNDDDTSDAPGVVMINQTLAREAFKDSDPIGQRSDLFVPTPHLQTGTSWRTVVGVVADTRNKTLE